MTGKEKQSTSEQLEQWRKGQREKAAQKAQASREESRRRPRTGIVYSKAAEVILVLALIISLVGAVVGVIFVCLALAGGVPLSALSAAAGVVMSLALCILIGRARGTTG